MGNACTTENPDTPWCGGSRDAEPSNEDSNERHHTRGEASDMTKANNSKSANNASIDVSTSNLNQSKPQHSTSTGSATNNTNMKNFRVLLLGAGESGKTTFTQQLNLIYNMSQLQPEERKKSVLQAIHENLNSIITSVYSHAKYLQINDPHDIHIYESIIHSSQIDKTYASNTQLLWSRPWMQESFSQRTTYWILDTAQWLIDNLDRFASPDYSPTKDDILKSRRRTTGITEHQYVVDNTSFTIIDVGGQRSERRKWIQFFADVHCVIFFVSVVGFMNVLFEDKETSQMKESLELFAKTFRVPQAVPHAGKLDNDWTDYVFETTPIHLIFNKMDLLPGALSDFAPKFHSCFPQFKGDIKSLKSVTDYMNRQFIDRVVAIRSPPDTHFISAMNEKHVRTVFKELSKFLLEKEQNGLALNAFMAKENSKFRKDDKKSKTKDETERSEKRREKRIRELELKLDHPDS